MKQDDCKKRGNVQIEETRSMNKSCEPRGLSGNFYCLYLETLIVHLSFKGSVNPRGTTHVNNFVVSFSKERELTLTRKIKQKIITKVFVLLYFRRSHVRIRTCGNAEALINL